jgi:Flp pilus assembly protein TadG
MLLRAMNRRAGATAAQFAFVAPVIFLLVFGIIELGRALMVIHILSEVARDSARYAVVAEGSDRSTSNIQNYATTALGNYGITTTNTPSVIVNDSSATDASTATGPYQQTGSANFGKYGKGTEITVKLQVNVSEVTWLPFADFLSGSWKLTGQYTLRQDPM